MALPCQMVRKTGARRSAREVDMRVLKTGLVALLVALFSVATLGMAEAYRGGGQGRQAGPGFTDQNKDGVCDYRQDCPRWQDRDTATQDKDIGAVTPKRSKIEKKERKRDRVHQPEAAGRTGAR